MLKEDHEIGVIMVIGTNTKSQLQRLNSYRFVLRGYKCTKCKCICILWRGQPYDQQFLGQFVWYHLQVWICMLKENHEIVVKIVLWNCRILKRSQHWQLNSYSFVFELPTEFGNAGTQVLLIANRIR